MKNRITRALLPVAFLAVAAISPVATANAAEPIVLPAGVGCEFSLQISSTGGNLHTKDFTDKNGNVVRSITAGKGVVLTYTNLESGESVTIRTDGSVSQTRFNKDGTQTVTLTGHNGLVLFPGDVPAGPTTTQYTGRVVFTIDQAGIFTLVSTAGPARDICAELSA